jgi:hypothetical protein
VATRSHTTFKKRQKELARVEKQKDKAEKRMQRKQQDGGERESDIMSLEEAALLRSGELTDQ